jgi:hypothetical protein
MRKDELKLLAVDALGPAPDLARPRALRSARPHELRAFLQWLDHSGLALYFGARLKQTPQWNDAPAEFRCALERRVQANALRTEALLADFRAVSAALRQHRVPHAFLKGFTLAPAFCPDPSLRHQSDLDVLIAPEFLDEASCAVVACGYEPQPISEPSEFRFATSATHVPTLHDDIYSLPPRREVELHTSIWAAPGDVQLAVPENLLSRLELREMYGISFPALSLEDAFLVQVLHAFGHLLGSWLRVSWLWEIHYFVEIHAADTGFWQSFRERAGDDPQMRKAIGLVLSLTRRFFQTRIPAEPQAVYLDPLPVRIFAWVEHYGTRWALAGIAGSKLSLFVHREFFDRDATWRAYFLRRMLPRHAKTSPGLAPASDAETRLRGRITQIEFTARRLFFHAGAALSFTWEAFRWRHALHASRRARPTS